MLHDVTLCTHLRLTGTRQDMPREIQGVKYYSIVEVCDATGIARQTLWRWRNEGLVPGGHRFRNGQVLFAKGEYDEILEWANRVEPGALTSDRTQLGLALRRDT